MAPAQAHRDMYVEENGEVNLEKSQYGHLSAGVPGTVAGLFETAKFGRLSFERLIEPAIALAEKGFVITSDQAASFNSIIDEL